MAYIEPPAHLKITVFLPDNGTFVTASPLSAIDEKVAEVRNRIMKKHIVFFAYMTASAVSITVSSGFDLRVTGLLILSTVTCGVFLAKKLL